MGPQNRSGNQIVMNTSRIPLTAPTEASLQDIGSADILVGIPSYNNADTVGHVVQEVDDAGQRAEHDEGG